MTDQSTLILIKGNIHILQLEWQLLMDSSLPIHEAQKSETFTNLNTFIRGIK